MAYLYRLEGYYTDWQPAYTGRAEYQDLPEGEYTFQVQAVDRDLNYSKPVTVTLASYRTRARKPWPKPSRPPGKPANLSARVRRCGKPKPI